ncbi:unnamed protein product [Urochloa decumbens]|uniref:Phospholipase A1 n=1 Tax=Urochloa decumbens TaxID=240449 RepID=A0ABC8WUK0_9POAL
MPSSGTGNGTAAGTVGGQDKGKGWRELHGARSWDGLLDPLDLELRKSIISYGEMVQAAEDGFNAEERSPHVGACLYGHSDLLRATGADDAAGRYEVTKFVYATSAVPCPFLQIAESNFIGYVAVATDEGAAALGRRDIVVAWRGTVRWMEWVDDALYAQTSAKELLGWEGAMVHSGFLTMYTATNAHSKFNISTSARDQVLEEVKRLMELYKDEETSITVTGYSLGAALSILNAVDIVAHRLNLPPGVGRRSHCPVTAIVFACPRVGNPAFSHAFHSFQYLRALHVRNEGDPVHKLPPAAFKYADVGVALDIHTRRSPYLRPVDMLHMLERVANLHNLECYLHGVAGEQGAAGGFKLEVDRDVALVNKRANALTEEHHVPTNWWVAQNKRMVRGADGHWKLNDFVRI